MAKKNRPSSFQRFAEIAVISLVVYAFARMFLGF